MTILLQEIELTVGVAQVAAVAYQVVLSSYQVVVVHSLDLSFDQED